MAAFVTPSAVKIGERWALCPAAFVAPVMISETNDVRVGLLFGILPNFVVAGIIFSVWAMVLKGRSHAAPGVTTP